MKTEGDQTARKALEQLIQASAATAGGSVAKSVGAAARQMTAEEVYALWSDAGVVTMATVGATGSPHLAPIHATLEGVQVSTVMYDDALRREDLRTNPRVALSVSGARGAVLLAYGRAQEVPGSLRPARDSAQGDPRQVVAIRITLSRVYAMRGRRPE